jgi:Binding-protein-dependent transport system inner membrane component
MRASLVSKRSINRLNMATTLPSISFPGRTRSTETKPLRSADQRPPAGFSFRANPPRRRRRPSSSAFLGAGFIQDVPKDLESAAKIDGCTRMQIFRMIVSPLIMPGLAASATLSIHYSWNELLFSLQEVTVFTDRLPS